ncbi:SMI1/KNR4 family protein [Brevibacterium sp. UMB1308A]|uniref:SMI1/KNR4 family protein n=1 Tax=Brevibacterium sp. UMB1308A TaxID=3050608 RepID=UPI00254CA1FC|nr:SMI1/KNR4 family protein [Brevibacterium sp. UMB1308A]MDK8345607.1 SMI1/KNR4 family protein [Brevibacterium sp. UMB1308B]MDK8713211.1 SMI1/KNR4 family protein [Brevibacterium sp. UMB1308A]
MAFPVDESRIRAAEEALGRTFPDVLRERLMSENGGEIDDTDEGYWFLYPVYDDSDRRRLARSADHVVKVTETWRSEADGFPQDAVPVAEDQEGNAIVLLPGDDRFYVWDHELRETEPIELIFYE